MPELTRRQFGRALGAALVAAPFLSLLQAGAARAGSAGRATRMVVFFSPNGTVLRHWRPVGTETSFSFPAGSILEPLTPVKSHLTVVDGLDFKNASNHEGGMAAMLTGGGTGGATAGKSLDQVVAGALGGATRFPSLELGVQTSAWGGSVQTRMSYAGPGQYVPPDDDPASVYRRLFGDLQATPAQVDERLRRRQSVLDLVKWDLGQLQKRLGGEERIKLDRHLEAVRQVERGLGGGGSGGAAAGCAVPAVPAGLAVNDNARFPDIGKAQMDLLVMALACGLTRVASLQWAHTVAPQVMSWEGLSEGHHALSHMDDSNTAGVAQFVKAERWFASQFAYLVQALADAPDPVNGGSLLDGTLVLWCKEMGDSRLHECKSVPFVLAGKAGGALRPGRYLKYQGDSHQGLLVGAARAMGLKLDTFGDGTGGRGPLAGLLA